MAELKIKCMFCFVLFCFLPLTYGKDTSWGPSAAALLISGEHRAAGRVEVAEDWNVK